MKTKKNILLVIGIIVVGVIMFFALRKNTEAPVVGQLPVDSGAAMIAIASYQFNPNALIVKKGTPVTWINNDSAPHAIIGDDKNSWAGGSTMKRGETYTRTFDTVGTFTYNCTIHPSMKGSIVVIE